MTAEQVDDLRILVSERYSSIVFWLKNRLCDQPVSRSKRLFELADSITEIKSICRCGRKATVNTRFDEKGYVCTSGDQVVIGGNDVYESMCWSCRNKLIVENKTRYDLD